ncbi:zinc finger protein 62-like [Pectinophora gossypiella]|uniref:zinc finger protein 62-like n=1 Tax=Pectinophora gossypiella TaxID=13191 RepID=UPI00214F2049|nr:zinc finger protein 62-like [Pectinophora gossypiella]
MAVQANLERYCRLCAEEQEVTIMIFSAEAEAMLLQNKLNKYLLIEVDEDDKLPKNICIKCCSKLQTVCEFIDTARKAQQILLDRSIVLDQMTDCFTNSNIKAESPSDDDEMEVSVDPMVVLQNSEETMSLNFPVNCQSAPNDMTNMHVDEGEFATIKLIKKGDQTMAVDISSTTSTIEEKRDRDSKPFPCLTCRRSFLTELALKNHLWVHINEDKTIKRYQCSHCPDNFDYKYDLISHLKEHRTSGTCNLCGRAFRTEANLKAHMALHLTAGKSYTCKVCGRSYNTRSNLTTHSITHSNERPYQCHICKKSFKRNQDLKFHLNQHTGAKPYKCPFCDKSFASSGNCYSHRSRMHPGRRLEPGMVRRRVNRDGAPLGRPPRRVAASSDKQLDTRITTPKVTVKGVQRYQCSMCDHSFIRRDNFTYHMYQHTGQKPFQCSFCSERFITRKGLLLHHDKEHQERDRPLALLSKNVLLK